MKIIFLFISYCMVIMSNDSFIYKKTINPTMSILTITKMIENASNGTVFQFTEGTYDFYHNDINLSNKNNIALVGIGTKTKIKNSRILILESSNVILKSLNFVEGKEGIILQKSNNFYIENFYIKNFNIIIVDSKGMIKHGKIKTGIPNKKIAQNPISIYLYNSKVKIDNISIFNVNQKSSVYLDKSSAIDIENSYFSKIRGFSIESRHAKILSKNNIFTLENCYIFKDKSLEKYIIYGKSYDPNQLNEKDKKLCKNAITIESNPGAGGILTVGGSLIATHNKFMDQERGAIETLETESIISNNKFKNGYGVRVALRSHSYISANEIENTSSAVIVHNSKSDIRKNTISRVTYGIRIEGRSEANIVNNTLLSMVDGSKYKHYRDGSKIKSKMIPIKSQGIKVEKGSRSNIKNNHFNQNSKLGYISRGALVYLNSNDEEFFFESSRWSHPEESKSELAINIKEIEDFSNIFNDIKQITIDYKILKSIDSQNSLKKKISTNILKGLLSRTIIVENTDGDEEEIEKGTYIVFDRDNMMLIKPKEYTNIKLEKEPKVDISEKSRKIKISTELKIKKNKLFVYFIIDSNVNIKEVIFNGNPLKIKDQTIRVYKTKGRRILESDKMHSLIINGDGFNLSYNCKKDVGMNIVCKLNDSPEI